MCAATYETLIGLLAATGLRISEAIKLDRADIDWTEGVLLVRESKFDKSRCVPVHDSTLEALKRYALRRDELCPSPREESFFVSLAGITRRYSNAKSILVHAGGFLPYIADRVAELGTEIAPRSSGGESRLMTAPSTMSGGR